MRVLLDETLCDIAADSVVEAIAAVAVLAEERGRAIVEVLVDGTRWTQDDLNAIARAPDAALSAAAAPNAPQEVRLTSADRIELVRETFHHALEALADAQHLQEQAADQLRADQTVEAMGLLGDALEIWAAVQQAVLMGAEMAGLDLDADAAALGAAVSAARAPGDDETSPAAPSINETIKGLHQQLQAVRDALESHDPAALSDTLLYELPLSVRNYRVMLSDLQDQLAGRASS